MEQKKTLWIIAAVGAFLLVVLFGAFFRFGAFNRLPGNNKTQAFTKSGVSPVEKHEAGNGWSKNSAQKAASNQPVALPDENNTKISDMVVFADNATVYETSKKDPNGATTIDLNDLKRELLSENVTPAQPQQPQNINITVNIPEGATAVTDASAPVVTKTAYVEPEPKSVKVAKAAPEKAAKPQNESVAKKPAAKSTPKAAQASAAVSKAEPKKTQFWVQVAAYSNKKGAEGARTVLDSNKIPADIFTYKDNKDKLFYRVRVGPYTTKSEAEYWRTRIVKIDNFAKADSYVTSTTN